MSRLTNEELQKVVDSLIGWTEPEGDSYIDKTRLNNTKLLVDLTYHLIDELCELKLFKDKYEASVKEIGQTAYDCLDGINNILKYEL